MFFRLGVLNIKRQISRSLLVLATLALAAVSLTYSLFVQKITPPAVAPLLGKFTGGEILVVPLRWAGQQTEDLASPPSYRYTRLVAGGNSWLEWFYPELYSQGFWVNSDETVKEYFNDQDVKSLAAFPGIAEAVVTPLLPVMVEAVGDRGTVFYPLKITPSTSRLDAYREFAEGSASTTDTDGLWLNNKMTLPAATPAYKAGQTVRLLLPKESSLGGLDFALPLTHEAVFAGQLMIPTRPMSWYGPGENIWEGASSLQQETGQLKVNLAWAESASWQELLRLTGLKEPLPVSNLALKVSNLATLDETIVRLRASYPHLTFVNMGQVEERLYATGSLEYFRRAPDHLWKRSEQAGLVVPQSFTPVFSILFLLIAGLLLGGHMLTGVAARNKEIGMLRALGARRRDVLVLGASETGFLTFIGVTAGFVALRALGLMLELRSGQPVLSVLGRVCLEYSQVLGLSVAVSLFFALLPIWQLSRVTPMEVLRHE